MWDSDGLIQDVLLETILARMPKSLVVKVGGSNLG